MAINEEKEKLQCKELMLDGLNCPVCATKIVKEVNKIPEIDRVDYNTVTGTLNIESSSKLNAKMKDKIQKTVDGIETGVTVVIDEEKNKNIDVNAKEHSFHSHISFNGKSMWRLGTGSLFLALALIANFIPVITVLIPRWLILIFFVFSYILIGGSVVASSVRNILNGQIFDEKFLMTVATLGAFAIGEYPEAVAVMLFYMIGEILQDKAVRRSRNSIRELMDIKPDFANIKINNKIKKVSPEEVNTGEIIIVKPGEKIPIDGNIIEGKTMVDTSALTGESVPREIKPGDSVLSGMINKNGLITVRTTKKYSDSTVSRILDLVENASSKKSHTEKFITKFARYYTPAVVFTALAIAVIPPLFFTEAVFSDWLYRALVFLVISCPCALVISIPLGFFAGIGRASRQGILIKGGNYLEALRKIEKVVFDKTGTLTQGKFAVSKVVTVNRYTEKEVLKLAATAENHSTHPIAVSIKEEAAGKLENEIIKSYEEISGYGVKVKTADKSITVGRSKFLEEESIDIKPVNEEGTIVYVAVNNELAGYIVITDKIKKDAFSALNSLREMGIKKLLMLTGDRETVARRVAEKLKLDKYYAQLLPDGKVNKMEEIINSSRNSSRVAFVGDGINDAPVLARSDIGIAMGALGSDAAIEAADVVLMTDELKKLPEAVKIARGTGVIVWQNIILVLSVKAVVLVMGILGIASMWSAVFADVGVALLAVLNSVRILNMRE